MSETHLKIHFYAFLSPLECLSEFSFDFEAGYYWLLDPWKANPRLVLGSWERKLHQVLGSWERNPH